MRSDACWSGLEHPAGMAPENARHCKGIEHVAETSEENQLTSSKNTSICK
jgi:hypothetical protein